MAEQSSAIAHKLLEISAVRLQPNDPFTWASGIKSPIYCDNRVTLSYPPVRDLILKALYQQSANFEDFDLVAGVATAGIPNGVLLADRLKKPFAYVRDKAKAHGRQNQIEGRIEAGQRVLVVEDLISTGGSSFKAVEALRAEGLHVVGVLAIFSYDFDEATQLFAKNNCPLITITGYNKLLQEAVSMGYISADDRQTLEDWRSNPKTWKQAESIG
ncbi:MAG: hypothetical protein RL757_1948 [Bacteroidota bacterium]|jgi:orotate phosphoribosyltransferase